MSLLGVNEVWELDRILDEEDWGIVTDHIVVSFLRVELDGESSWISVAVVSTALTGDSGEAEEAWSLLADLVKEVSLCETKREVKLFEDDEE